MSDGGPRQPLFPFRYETWEGLRSGRRVAVIDYRYELGDVEYMYFGEDVVYTMVLKRFMASFRFITSP